jgi:hypothetical protein
VRVLRVICRHILRTEKSSAYLISRSVNEAVAYLPVSRTAKSTSVAVRGKRSDYPTHLRHFVESIKPRGFYCVTTSKTGKCKGN